MGEVKAMRDRPYSRDEVIEIIQSVMTNVAGDSDTTKKLKEDLAALSDYIRNMRAELAQMRSIEISCNHIPSATDELDAVVEETARATGTIMDSCEKIEEVAGVLVQEQQDILTGQVTAIYEACGFQDITGQRITKVVKALKNIENKVVDILDAFGHAAPGMIRHEDDAGGDSLMNGPQLAGQAVSQAEIDRLLADFDN